MPIDIKIGGVKTSAIDLKTLLGTADQDVLLDRALEGTSPAQGATEALQGMMNEGNLQNAVTQNRGYTQQDVEQNPQAYNEVKQDLGQVTGTLNEAGYATQEPGFNLDESAGIGPLGDRIGGAGTDFRKVQEVNQAQAIQQDIGQMTPEQFIEKHNFLPNQKAVEAQQSAYQVIDNYQTMSKAVHEQVQNFQYKLVGPSKTEFIQELTNEVAGGKYNVDTVSKYINGLVTNYAYAQQNGIPRAFSDIIMAAQLHAGKKAYAQKLKLEEDLLKRGLPETEAEESLALSTATDEQTGRIINEAMGIEASPEANAIAGAMARKIMQDVHGNTVDSNGDIIKEGLFGVTKRGVLERGGDAKKQYNAQEITRKGIIQYHQMKNLINMIIPNAQKKPRNTPLSEDRANVQKIYETKDPGVKGKARLKKAILKTIKPRRAAILRDSDYGDWTRMNHYLDTLADIGYTYDQEVLSVYEMVQGHELFDKMLGIEYETLVDGSRVERTTDVDPKTGQTEKYLGNDTRRAAFDEDLDYMRENGNKPVWFDYFVGGNNRMYVDATVGNYQSSKFARAALQAQSYVTYDLSNVRETQALKAGIMKKFAYDKLDVANAAAKFDQHAARWASWLPRLATEENVKTQFLQEAQHEGAASISAMIEGAKLYTALNKKSPTYAGSAKFRSKFFTEVDGIANGIAHTAMQSGGAGAEVTAATGIFSDSQMAALKDFVRDTQSDTDTPFNDVYVLTANNTITMLEKAADGTPKGLRAQAVLDWFRDENGKSLINRKLGKKPMMVFGYGASDSTIVGGVIDFAENIIRDRPDILEKMGHALGSDVDAFKLASYIGETVSQAINIDFAHLKLVNDTMKWMANTAGKSATTAGKSS